MHQHAAMWVADLTVRVNNLTAVPSNVTECMFTFGSTGNKKNRSAEKNFAKLFCFEIVDDTLTRKK